MQYFIDNVLRHLRKEKDKMISIDEMRAVLERMGKDALSASYALAAASTAQKQGCLRKMADFVMADVNTILKANAEDMKAGAEKGLSPAMLDRLRLDEKRLAGMADGIRQIASQHDPVGRLLSENTRPNGLVIRKVSVPIGVIGIIYESRPNVTGDAAAICIWAGNTVILRGGSEAIHSNCAIAAALSRAAKAVGFPETVVQLVPFTEHEAVNLLVKMDRYLSLVIPRGGERLIRAVVEAATMPVIKHYKGVCHIFVDDGADIAQALKIIVNAKCQRPGVCNTIENLLIDRKIAAEFIPQFASVMRREKVELRGDDDYRAFDTEAVPATEEDFYTEYMALILSCRVVDGVEAAVAHINQYGSHHSDSILSKNAAHIEYFFGHVDSSTVYANASTRFTDGGEFGMGAEIGISTDKIHARGPVGADELTSYKYLVTGAGQIR